MRPFSLLLIPALPLLSLLACSKADDTTPATTPTTVEAAVPEVYRKIYGASSITLDGDYVVIKAKNLPDHKSPYYSGTSYEAYNGANAKFKQNPNTIREQNFTYRIPRHPQEATRKSATPLGSIGVSLNGVAFFNQYAGPAQPLTNEIDSFDQYNGHPQGTGIYHYHVEPTYLTISKGRDVLLGFLLDGFPVYGPVENGAAVTNAALDAYHGHTHATADYPAGTYHYHITNADPYLNGDGFFGTPGTITQ
ncbi:YHYH protein [Hymenobacter psychrophilus]|uniref:YHYH protein n=1 Tax=Hymenobacter psychrophilus TaxID=651662 RepID=A0A1H3LBP4_9BACT|nr:YHYH protein [Hymenobacter psychrophilus]SDY61599.1 YHYH protein [Hymenobacter psychrophilus]